MAKRKTSRRSPPRRNATRRKTPSGRNVTSRKVTRPAHGEASARPHSQTPLTVVGLGASAGGLEALTRLLQNIDPKTEMAFVVVQHLAPRHESVLPDLLSASSTISVVQVRNGMPLQAGRVHVIPPNVGMTVTDGALRLAPRALDRSQHHPIDEFFGSLAEYAAGRAVGVVLSGSATDGAIGARDIKSAGGIVLAQEPKSAKYDSMPRAAIATGVVDLVLTPEQIAQELNRLNEHPFLRVSVSEESTVDQPFSERELEELFSVLRSTTGVDFSHYKLPTIRRRLQRRMLLHKTTQLGDYLAILQDNPEEVKALYRDILIHVTRFFREPESFEALKREVFPRTVEDAGGKRPIRIWVPGCATGEEPYSIAIALIEYLGPESTGVPIQVFATDVSEEAIDHARLGLYPESIAADVSAERLRRFFTRVDGQYRISKLVRDSCIFARQDLTRDPPFSKLDLIVCRNVLIYIGPRLQRKLMSVFHYALKTAGFLMLGSTESVGTYGELFSLVDKRHRVYSKRPGHPRPEFDFVHAHAEGRFERDASSKRIGHQARRPGDVQHEITRTLLSRYSPPGVVVDHDFQIIQTRGRTGLFLELATGDASLNLLKMAREGLLHGLRSALMEARKTLKPVRREGLIVKTNGASREIDLQVLPMRTDGESPYLLVLFEAPVRQRAEGRARPNAKTKDKRVERMQQELSSSREYLQSIIQDLEAANEELQSANEEILSSNEELQSTNEELDTAKEELQSTNEELNTVNEELNARNDELSHVNSDLVNLLTAVPAAVVIVSSELKIRRFTPVAEQVLNLIPTDVGRPLSDIKPNIDTTDLEELTREVIDTVTVRDLEARDRSGRLYAVRIRPYKNQENRIDGAVLAFAEVGRSGEPSKASQEALRSMVDSLPTAILLLDDELKVQAANQRLLKLLDMRASSVRGRPLTELDHGQWNRPHLVAAIERMRSSGEPFSNLTVELTPKRPLHVDGSLVGSGAQALMMLTIREAAREPAPATES